jgi:hypothetical protein
MRTRAAVCGSGSASASQDKNEGPEKYCVPNCREPNDSMVACDNSECLGQWFHYRCVGLTKEPTSKTWYHALPTRACCCFLVPLFLLTARARAYCAQVLPGMPASV